ncbi:MAG: ribosome biogenesis GTP-binding protein YihA/YsxC [candidate division KSB1 bacterium]|nr:ribosome biogenesis GTP-binding protein YihA/YsxC [candidate division KSB1 bacterium]MDZ7335633.1 ribosome biogenesis GTP-binding protein YihA/YsxC [candidate division KSB1 bacterium]MDZ7358077.1 ribosome biogenesis GTP-binding protein YihA/YsxC [candidate division KSB1 bacterium]MDZ7377137.1 ribosome biogenesis GTP-binding protein YihA/YsxC [candidate division KSB1 bacterium]MDZ7399843.1 ribosome biogenesis GTP-binding protein YihA/YsxC [candidate division KSB1 bacterium]
MKPRSVKFIASVGRLQDIRFFRLPEIAVAGRSNVGKSSLINRLVGHRKLAEISSTPGKTRTLNFYCIDDEFYLVDLPGYGYAKVSQQERKTWRQLIESYVTQSRFLIGMILIVDSRHGITDLDREMINWLAQLGVPTLLIATKIDKLSRNQAVLNLRAIEAEAIQMGIAAVIGFSAKTGQGKDQIWQAMLELLRAPA